MKAFLIKQGIFLPLIYFGFIFLAGAFANDYSHVGQHASELGINSSKIAVLIFQLGIMLTSVSLFFLALGLKLNYKGRFNLSSIMISAFGITFVFGAVFPITSPWHGLFGFGLFIMMLPFVFLYELNQLIAGKFLYRISLAAGLLMFIYLWAVVARLDPVDYRGLTQRLFGIVVFGWFSFISYQLDRFIKESKPGS